MVLNKHYFLVVRNLFAIFTLILEMSVNQIAIIMKYNLSVIMKRAWSIYRAHNHQKSWSDSLRESWSIAKNNIGRVTFRHIYDTYYSGVVSYIASRIGDFELAQEIGQDVFVRINDHLQSYDVYRGKVKTWVYSIVNNAIIDEWRRKKQSAVHVDGYTDEEGNKTFDFIDGSTDLVERNELSEQINRAMCGLKERERRIVQMYYFENRKYDEIAEELELSLSNIKVTLMRTKKKLQEQLESVYKNL